MSNYRPKDWNNPHLWVDEDGFDKWGEHYDSYEAGADAILEKLKDSGTFTYGHHSPDIDDQEISGYWAFIPDEE